MGRRNGAGRQPGSHGNGAGERDDHCSGACDHVNHCSGTGELSLITSVVRPNGAGEGHPRAFRIIDIGEIDGDSDSSSEEYACVLFSR